MDGYFINYISSFMNEWNVKKNFLQTLICCFFLFLFMISDFKEWDIT